MGSPSVSDRAMRWTTWLGTFQLAPFNGIVIMVLSLSAKRASKKALLSGDVDSRASQSVGVGRSMRTMTTAIALDFRVRWSHSPSVISNMVESTILSGLSNLDGERRNAKAMENGTWCCHKQARKKMHTGGIIKLIEFQKTR